MILRLKILCILNMYVVSANSQQCSNVYDYECTWIDSICENEFYYGFYSDSITTSFNEKIIGYDTFEITNRTMLCIHTKIETFITGYAKVNLVDSIFWEKPEYLFVNYGEMTSGQLKYYIDTAFILLRYKFIKDKISLDAESIYCSFSIKIQNDKLLIYMPLFKRMSNVKKYNSSYNCSPKK